MENNLEHDIEIQLQEELKRLKKAVGYIEQAKIASAQSQQIFDNTQSKFNEMSEMHESLKQAFHSSISEIENKTKNIKIEIETKFVNQFSSIQQDIQKLSNSKTLIIDNVKSELSKEQKSIEINLNKKISEQNIKIADLTKKIKSSKKINFILFALIVSVIIIIVRICFAVY